MLGSTNLSSLNYGIEEEDSNDDNNIIHIRTKTHFAPDAVKIS